MQQSTSKEKTVLKSGICSKCGKTSGFSNTNLLTGWILKPAACQCPPEDASTAATEGATTRPSSPTKSIDEGAALPNLGSRFEMIARIGHGGMGYVYKARDTSIDTIVAVKVLQQELVQDQAALKRFEQEAESAKQLTHPNLVSVYDHGTTDDGAPFIVMDYLDGISLDDLLKEGGHLDTKRALKLLKDICEALAYAHKQGVLHRDIKPTNIIITGVGSDTEQAHIVDFGIAKVMPTANRETHDLTQTGEIFGSPQYMSPEQCLGFMLDSRSDIYSLGCLMYELFTGATPFEGANPIQLVVKHINEDPPAFSKAAKADKQMDKLENITLHCLSKDKNDRYQSADEVLKDLSALAAGKAVTKYATITKAKPTLTRKQTVGVLVVFIGVTIYGTVLATTFNNEIGGKLFATVISALCLSGTYVFISSAFDIYRKRLKVLTEANAWCIVLFIALGVACLTISQYPIGMLLSSYNFERDWGQFVFFNNIIHIISLFTAMVAAIGFGIFRKAGGFKPLKLAAKFLSIAVTIIVILWYGVPHQTSRLVTIFASSCAHTQPQLGRNLYQLASVLEPESVETLTRLADIEYTLKMYKESIETREKCFKLQPQQVHLLYALADAFEQIKEYDKALEQLNKAVELEPTNSSTYQKRAEFFEKRGMLDKAVDDLRMEQKLGSKTPYNLEHLARLECRLGNFNEAIEPLKALLVIKESDINDMTLMGMVYDQVGRHEDALRMFEDVLRLSDTRGTRGLVQAYVAYMLGRNIDTYYGGGELDDVAKNDLLNALGVKDAPFRVFW